MTMLSISLGVLCSLSALGAPQDVAKRESAVPEVISWYGTWEQGAAEAKRLGLPIFLHSAAPRCGGVPGMW